jgi:sialate O-acetylesterase
MMRFGSKRSAVLILAVAGLAAPVWADVKLSPLMSDHMVLQRDRDGAVWGTADVGEKATVTFRGASAEATADADGRWKTAVATGHAGGPFELTVTGKNTVAIKDVLVGEVWLCSGQSNMQFPVGHAKDAKTELPTANHPMIRLFGVARTPSDEPAAQVNGEWQPCTPTSAATFSAAAYYFARDLQPAIDVPIGLIESDWGGTPIESWMSREALSVDPATKKKVDAYFATPLASEEEEATYKQASNDFQAARISAAKNKTTMPTSPPATPKGKRLIGENRMTRLYSGMIAPVAPYGIRGALWYQGEANAGGYGAYQSLLPAMITDWRKTFGQGDFPFLVVQLPNHGARTPGDNQIWAFMREAQAMAVTSVPNAAVVCTIDTSSDGDLHPPEKQPVGHRLALMAEKMVFEKDVVAQGPTFESLKLEGDKAVITFKNIGDGLVVKGPKMIGFMIAGENQQFAAADATIEGDTVVVHSDQVTKPLAVRYAWANNPEVSLYNKADLPALPFRTDTWPAPSPKKAN